MKKQYYLFLLMVWCHCTTYAQWNSNATTSTVSLTNATYNVGIGVSTPEEKLHVNGAVRGNSTGGSLRIKTATGYLDIGSQTAGFANFMTDRAAFYFEKPLFLQTGEVNSVAPEDLKLQVGGANRLVISNTSTFVGIGVDIPQAKLHVAGPLLLDSTTPTIYTATASTDQNKYLLISNSPSLAVSSGIKSGGILVADAYNYANPNKNTLIVKQAIGIGTDLVSNPNNYSLFVNGKVNATSFYINDQVVVSSQWTTANSNVYFNGGVGIGTPLTDNPRGYKLAVAGKIGAKDVRVENESWPDYVFNDDYDLPPLREVRAYINQHRHLSEIPSAETIENEGHELGAMDALLLKKVEELTLYLLQLEEKNEVLHKRVEELEKSRKNR